MSVHTSERSLGEEKGLAPIASQLVKHNQLQNQHVGCLPHVFGSYLFSRPIYSEHEIKKKYFRAKPIYLSCYGLLIV